MELRLKKWFMYGMTGRVCVALACVKWEFEGGATDVGVGRSKGNIVRVELWAVVDVELEGCQDRSEVSLKK